MERTEEIAVPASPLAVFEWVDDLARYPRWLDLVRRAEPEPPGPAPAGWTVELRARVGPLARSKRLRMVRTLHDVPRAVRFERVELDGRSHSSWVLDVSVGSADGGGAVVAFRLDYGGSLFEPLVDQLLRAAVDRARPKLLACVAG